jgi:hypothetical protein
MNVYLESGLVIGVTHENDNHGVSLIAFSPPI